MADFSYYNKVGFALILPLLFVFFMMRIDMRKTKRLFFVFLSNSYFFAYSTDKTQNISLYNVLKFSFTSSLLTLLILLFLYDKEYLYTFFLESYFTCLGISVLYLLVKQLVSELIYQFFNKKIEYKQVLILENSYLTSFLVLNYIVISYAFLHLKELNTVFIIICITLLLSYVFRLVKMLINNKSLLSVKLFYIISYLCILEISPFIYLFKRYLV